MRNVVAAGLAILASLSSASAEGAELSYVLQLDSDRGSPHLAVEMRLDGGPAGFTVLGFCLSEWPGLVGCGREIAKLQVRSAASGKLRRLEQREPNIWICDHMPGEPLVVSYELRALTSRDDHLFTPLIRSDAVTFIADTALLVPEHLLRMGETEVSYEWRGSFPKGWMPLSSFGDARRVESLNVTLMSFLRSLFYVGPAHVDVIAAEEGQQVRVAWLGSESKATSREVFLRQFLAVRKAIATQMAPAPHIRQVGMVFISGGENPRASAVSVGRGLLFFENSAAVSSPSELEAMLALAHELVHASPRYRFELVDAPVQRTFASEAFAEFIARRALYRAGLIDEEEWALAVSGKLASYARGNLNGAGVGDPYVVGDLLLLRLDREISRSSEGRAGLGDLLEMLQARSSLLDGKLGWSHWLDAIAELTAVPSASWVDEWVQGKEDVWLPDDLLTGCMRVYEEPILRFDPGFDAQRSLAAGRLVGVREGGPAWRAGLRDQERVVEWSIHWNRSDLPIHLVIWRDDRKQAVSFLPTGKESVGVMQQLSPIQDGRCGEVL